ncbi:MAG: hypothetical protein H6700_05875 [Myxococcales bacterium]|nr:hypothetical protein [Myxococcales bacterium]
MRPAPMRPPPVAGTTPGCLIVFGALPFGVPLIPMATHAVDKVFVAAGLATPRYSAATWLTGILAAAFVFLSPLWYTDSHRGSSELVLRSFVSWCYVATAVYALFLVDRLRAVAPAVGAPFVSGMPRRVLVWTLCAASVLPFVASIVGGPDAETGQVVRLLLVVAWFATAGLYSAILSWTTGA